MDEAKLRQVLENLRALGLEAEAQRIERHIKDRVEAEALKAKVAQALADLPVGWRVIATRTEAGLEVGVGRPRAGGGRGGKKVEVTLIAKNGQSRKFGSVREALDFLGRTNVKSYRPYLLAAARREGYDVRF